MDKLISVRIKSFGYSLLGVAVTGILGFIVSPDFTALVTENFGNSSAVVLITMLVVEAAKHIRNMAVISKLGAAGEADLI